MAGLSATNEPKRIACDAPDYFYAIHGHTAAELIAERAKADAPTMRLKTWKGAKPRKADATEVRREASHREARWRRI